MTRLRQPRRRFGAGRAAGRRPRVWTPLSLGRCRRKATLLATGGAGGGHLSAKAAAELVEEILSPGAAADAKLEKDAQEKAAGAAAATLRAKRPLLLKNKVEVHGLQSQPKFNGRHGIAVAYDRTAGRYAVELPEADGTKSKLKVREANLRLVPDDGELV